MNILHIYVYISVYVSLTLCIYINIQIYLWIIDDIDSQPTKVPIVKRALTTHEKKNLKLATQIAQIESKNINLYIYVYINA
jgi:hypothetical protein